MLKLIGSVVGEMFEVLRAARGVLGRWIGKANATLLPAVTARTAWMTSEVGAGIKYFRS